jgi:ferredoxin
VAATAGFVSLFLLWLTACWGVTLKAGWGSARMRHATAYGVHMTCALTGLTLGGVHALTQLAVPHGPIGVIDEFIPFLAVKHPLGVGLGVVATELMIAFALSVLVQRKMGYHRWRRLHNLAYLAYLALAAHVILSGSEMRSTWSRAFVGGTAAFLLLLWVASTGVVTKARHAMADKASGRARGRLHTVQVDPTRCVRFGFCEHEAPDVFHLRADGVLTYKPTVADGQSEKVIKAVSACPARAIVLGRQATAVVVPRPGTEPTLPPGPRHGPPPGPMHGPHTGPLPGGPIPHTGPIPGTPIGGPVQYQQMPPGPGPVGLPYAGGAPPRQRRVAGRPSRVSNQTPDPWQQAPGRER